MGSSIFLSDPSVFTSCMKDCYVVLGNRTLCQNSMHCFPNNFIALKTILSESKITTQGFFWFLFAWYHFLYSNNFVLSLPLYLMWASHERQSLFELVDPNHLFKVSICLFVIFITAFYLLSLFIFIICLPLTFCIL